MRALISGYYGFGNLGDEALLEIMIAQLRARFPALTLDVLSARPQETAAGHDVETTLRSNLRSVRAAIGRADVVISGGGGLLQNATSLRSLMYYAGILREAVAQGKKAMIFAQSIGPLDFVGRIVVRRFCRGVACASVRDARSAVLLRGLLPATPVEQTADPVFLYDIAPEEFDLAREGLGAPGERFAIISVRKIPSLRDGIETLARAVDRLRSKHGIRTAFLPLGGVDDAEVSTTIIRSCKSAPMLLPECNLAKAAGILRAAHVVIGMRLHALILAARFGVPFVAVPYDPKVSALCEDLRYPLEALWTPGSAVPPPARVDALIDQLVSQRDALCEHLSGQIQVVRTAAARNFELLGELILQP